MVSHENIGMESYVVYRITKVTGEDLTPILYPLAPHPLFKDFIKAALKRKRK